MTRPITKRNYNSHDLTAKITDAVSPAATLSLLLEADTWPVDAAVSPYCGCGHVFDGLTSLTLEDRYFGVVVAPGAVHGRAALSRCWGNTKAGGAVTSYHEMWSTDGGTSGDEVIHVQKTLSTVFGYVINPLFQYGNSDVAVSSNSIIDVPLGNQDRQIELQTLDAPYVEPMYVSAAAGFSLLISDQIADLESL